ncbi:MAG: DUF4294 domain-containing protein [Bacteroidia bacterium]
MKRIMIVAFMFCVNVLYAQNDTIHKTYSTVVEGDTIPLVYMQTVDVVASLSPEAAAQLKAYYILRRDVLRTYPYAKYAARKLKEINDHAETLSSEKEKRRYIKATEDDLKDKFEDDLKKLTINQGRILMKLIDRETGNDTYSVVKELRGGFKAFMWQGVAKIFGDNLKDKYDAAGEDKPIEDIVQQIETGQLPIPAAYQSLKLQSN